MARIEGTMHVEEWQEAPYVQQDDGRKLTKATVRQRCAGGLEGTMTTEYLMAYRADKTADYVGLQRIEGAIGDKRGGFVARLVGGYDGTLARGELTIVPGSGTGDFAGITGRGEFAAPHGPQGTYSFEYTL